MLCCQPFSKVAVFVMVFPYISIAFDVSKIMHFHSYHSLKSDLTDDEDLQVNDEFIFFTLLLCVWCGIVLEPDRSVLLKDNASLLQVRSYFCSLGDNFYME